jgi:hypothetical protein
MPDDMSWINEAARRSARNKIRQQDWDYKQARKAAQNRGQLAGPEGSPSERLLRSEQISTEIAKNRAMRTVAPRKWIGGPGMLPGVIEAPENYTGIQREIFLPKDSSFAGEMGPSRASLPPSEPPGAGGGGGMREEEYIQQLMRTQPGLMRRMFPQLYGRDEAQPQPQYTTQPSGRS